MEIQTFYAIVSVAALFVFFQKNIFSLSSLFFAGLVLYGLPLFDGSISFTVSYVHKLLYAEPPHPHIYFLFSCAFVGVIFLCIQSYFLQRSEWREPREGTFRALGLFQAVYFGLFVVTMGLGAIRVGDKSFFVENSPVSYFFCALTSGLLVLLVTLSRRKENRIYLILPCLFFALDIYIGYRTNFFLLICSLLVVVGLQQKPMSMFARSGAIGLGAIVALSAFVIKAVYYSIHVGGVENLQFVTSTTFRGSEPDVIMGNLNEILNTNFSLLAEEKWSLVLQHIPFAQSLFEFEPFSLNPFLQNQVFPKTEWGIASSGIGSMYLAFGNLCIVGYVSLLAVIQYAAFRAKSPLTLAVILLVAPYFFFYFHRNDWSSAFGTLKLTMIALGPVLLVRWVANRGVQRQERPA